MVSYCTRKKMAKEKQHRRLVEHMETKLRPNQRAIEMSPTAPAKCSCTHMHCTFLTIKFNLRILLSRIYLLNNLQLLNDHHF